MVRDNGTVDIVTCPNCEAEIVVDVREGEPVVPISRVREIIAGSLNRVIAATNFNNPLTNLCLESASLTIADILDKIESYVKEVQGEL